MKKEFEENEESKKTLENNLDIQDEIDDETFQKILEEEFIEREKQIEEALFADEDFEDLELTDEEVQDSYQKLMRRFEREKRANNMEASAELVPDEKVLRNVIPAKNTEIPKIDEKAEAADTRRVISMDEARERRNKGTTGHLHRLGRVVGMAFVAVACIFAASMTSEANRTYLVNSVRIWSGDDTKTTVDNDEKNERVNKSEEEAINDIEKQLGIKVPVFYYRPYGFEFLNYVIDNLTSLARIEYEYNDNIIILIMDKQDIETASKISSLDGNEKNNITIENEGVSVSIKKIYNEDNTFNYSAEWYKNETSYLLSGKIKLEEIKKIIEKMKF